MSWRDKWNAFLDKWLGEDACCHIEHSDLDDDTEELYDVSELDVRLNDPWSDDEWSAVWEEAMREDEENT